MRGGSSSTTRGNTVVRMEGGGSHQGLSGCHKAVRSHVVTELSVRVSAIGTSGKGERARSRAQEQAGTHLRARSRMDWSLRSFLLFLISLESGVRKDHGKVRPWRLRYCLKWKLMVSLESQVCRMVFLLGQMREGVFS